MRYLRLTAVLSLSILAPYGMPAQEPESPAIAGYELVSEQRVSPTESYLTYRPLLNGSLRHAAGFDASVAPRSSAKFTVVSGQDRLHFPRSTGRVRADGAFTVRVDPTAHFDLADLDWSIIDPQAPRANAGPGRTIRVGETVTLDAGASANPSGRGRLAYRWSVTRPAGSQGSLSDETSLRPAFFVDVPGDYLATLAVTNDAGLQSISRVRFSTRNSAPVAHAGRSQTAAPGSVAILNGAKSWDADGDSLHFHWTLAAMPRGSRAVLLESDSVSPRLQLDLPGDYLARLVVSDGAAESAATFVTVSTGNSAPLADAGRDRAAVPGSLIELNAASSTDVDGDPLTYEWAVISAPDGSAATLTDRSLVNPKLLIDLPGTYVAQLKVSDGVSDSDPVTVTITTRETLRPFARAGRNQSVVPGAAVRLDGSSLDPQGLPVHLRWALTSRPAGSRAELSDTDSATPSFVADAPGIYTAQLVAHNGVLPSDPATVMIATTDIAPIAELAPCREVAPGAVVALNAGASREGRRDLQHSWAILSRPAGSKASLSSPAADSPTFVADLPGAYVVQLTELEGARKSVPVTTLLTASPLSITTASLPVALLGISYSQAFTAAGGTPPYFWRVSGGRLPSGFALDSQTGILSGAAQFTISAFITVTVSDSDSPAQSAAAPFTLYVSKPSLTIVNTSLPAGQKGVPYGQTLTAVGGTAPYTWAVTAGSLPSGWTLNAATGVISGTATSAVVNSPVTIRVTDSAAPSAFTSLGYSINVTDSALAITSLTLPDGHTGVPYAFGLTASGAVGALNWSVTGGAVPAGLTLSAGGVLAGTPTAAAAALPLSVRVTDSVSGQSATANLTLTIVGGLTITTSSLPAGTVGTPYSASLNAAGAQGTLTWQLTAGTLPPGLTLNAAAGQISGTPTAPASAVPLTFKVTDATTTLSASASLTLTIVGGTLTITTNSLPDAFIGLPYSKQLTASGGTAPYFWTIASGRLPGGFTFDGNTGIIGGSPQFTDPASVVFRVTDALGQTATANLSVAIFDLSFSIVTSSLPSAQVGVPYSFSLQGVGGVKPYTWVIASGSLPGLSLNATTGLLSGTPTIAGSPRVTIRLIDSSTPTAQIVNTSLTLTINASSFTIVTPSLPNGSVGIAYAQTLSAVGGAGPLTWQLQTGTQPLPAGLTLNSSSGQISGVPTAPASGQPVSIKVTDSSSPAQVATATLSLTIVGSALAITTSSLPSGAVGTPYAQSLTAAGGSLPYSWQLISGVLPAGLTFNLSGQLSGTPTASVTALNLTFKVTDSASQSATAILALTIAAGTGGGSALTVVTTTLPSALVGIPFSVQLVATGGVLPYTWSLPAGRLPGGFNLSPNGIITGIADPSNMPDGFLDPLLLGFRVTDSSTPAQSVTAQLLFTMTKQSLQISTPALPTGNVGVPYSFTLHASGGGSGVYTWAVISGVLPGGLSLDTATGVISGIPSAAMARRIIISVNDPAPPPVVLGGSQQTVSASFTLQINP